MTLRFAAFGALALIACRGQDNPAAAVQTPPAVPPLAAAAPPDAGSDDYVPAEFKSGMARFKDCGVYLDGRPVGILEFGELPIALKPTWVKKKVNQEKPPGCPSCLAWKWAEQRFYRFNDYLRAIGIDPRTVREIHVQGPKVGDTIVATGRDLMQPDADGFMFRFGGSVSGKPIPQVPLNFGNGVGPDKITAVMIYVKRQPPKISSDAYILDGVPIEGVPYFGEPVRGGVRVYLDDKLAAIIKRQDLDAKRATTGSDGELSWSLWSFLASQGVDTSKVVEGWVIRDDIRHERIPAAELATMSFRAAAKTGKGNQGGVELGPDRIVVNALALHTHPLKPEDLPQIRPEEQD